MSVPINQMNLSSGISADVFLNTAWFRDGAWSAGPDMPHTGVIGVYAEAMAAISDTQVLIVGGIDDSGNVLGSTWIYDVEEESFTGKVSIDM